LLVVLNRHGVRVLNILGAGMGGKVDVDDLDLKHTFSGKRCADATNQYSYVIALAAESVAYKPR
jgi:hypothetical protein